MVIGCDFHPSWRHGECALDKAFALIEGHPKSFRRFAARPLGFKRMLQGLQILDDLHAFFRRELAADYAVAFGAVVEFVSGVAIAR